MPEKAVPKIDPQRAFVISQIGEPESSVRRRADEVFDYIVKPAAEKCGLTAHRSDHERKPGQVTSELIRSILESRVVIADMTGRNPNVYYELGVVHSFRRPVVLLVDHAASLSFDTQHERVIEILDDGKIGAREAEVAARALEESFRVVLDEGYRASSLVTEVAVAQALDKLAPNDAIAAEVASLREVVDDLARQSSRAFELMTDVYKQGLSFTPRPTTIAAGAGTAAVNPAVFPAGTRNAFAAYGPVMAAANRSRLVTPPLPSPTIADRPARRPRRRDKRAES